MALLIGCGASQDKKSAFKIKSKANFNSIQQNSSIEFRVESNKQYKIDSIRVFKSKKLEYKENQLQIPNVQIGNHSLDVKVYASNELHELRKKSEYYPISRQNYGITKLLPLMIMTLTDTLRV